MSHDDSRPRLSVRLPGLSSRTGAPALRPNPQLYEDYAKARRVVVPGKKSSPTVKSTMKTRSLPPVELAIHQPNAALEYLRNTLRSMLG